MGMHPWANFGLAGLNTFWVIWKPKPNCVNNSNLPVTLRNRPRSPILKLGQGLIGMHPWVKFGMAGLKSFWVMPGTKPNCVNNSNLPVTLRNRPRSPILELGRGLIGMHLWVKFGMAGLKTFWVMPGTNIGTDGQTDFRKDGFPEGPDGKSETYMPPYGGIIITKQC